MSNGNDEWAKSMRILWILAFVGALSLPLYAAKDAVPLNTALKASDVMTVLLILGIVATLLERTIEVVVAAFRTPKRTELEADVQRQQIVVDKVQKDIEIIKGATDPGLTIDSKDLAGKRAELQQEKSTLEDRRQALAEYKAITARQTGWVALVAGILISAAGVRTLNVIMDPALLKDFLAKGGFQPALFRFLDVFITGGLLAGGSKVIHQVAVAIEELFKALRPKTS